MAWYVKIKDMIRKVALLVNHNVPGAQKSCQKIQQLLSSRGILIEKKPTEQTDLLLTLGGDGTLLKGVHATKSSSTLIFGLKFGKVGFLTNQVDGLEERLEKILSGHYHVSERMLLKARLIREKKTVQKDFCLNEVILSRRGIRIVEISVRKEEEDLIRVRADAIIFATPTGSTAHALAAGGPVISPEQCLILVVAVCPYATSARPLVLPAESRLEVTVSAACTLVCDGQRECVVLPGDKLLVTPAEKKARLVFDEETSFFQRLEEKFGWPLSSLRRNHESRGTSGKV